MLRALRAHFVNVETDDEPGINDGRAYACEYVSWRLVLHLSEREAIDCLLTELPLEIAARRQSLEGDSHRHPTRHNGLGISRARSIRLETESLLTSPTTLEGAPGTFDGTADGDNVGEDENDGFASSFDNLHALEIAAVSGAKKFLSQRVIQKIIEKIWRGDIVFWETLSVGSEKGAKIYNKK